MFPKYISDEIAFIRSGEEQEGEGREEGEGERGGGGGRERRGRGRGGERRRRGEGRRTTIIILSEVHVQGDRVTEEGKWAKE